MPAHRKCNHNGPRFPSNGACKQCQIARRKARRQSNPELVNKYNRARRVENPERENAYTKKHRKSETHARWRTANRHIHLWNRAKHRAEKLGREFVISLEDTKRLLDASKQCPYTGVPYSTARGRNPWASSLDRKDSSKGYTLSNVEVTSVWWNLAKNSWDADTIKTALRGLAAYKS